MKNQIIIFLLLIPFLLFSQTLEENISNEICMCMGNLNAIEDPETKIETCVIKSLENFKVEIIKKLNQNENENSQNFEDYFLSIEGLLLNNCTKYLEYREVGLREDEKPNIKNCENLKIGIYYYEVLNPLEKMYLTFTENKVIESRKNNIYSISEIEWIEDCTYKLTTLETNSIYDEIVLNNKSLIFKIIEDQPDYFIVQTQYHENGGFNNVKIFKLPYINNVEN